jgi:hypothetical protein
VATKKKQLEYKPERQHLIDSIASLKQCLVKHEYKPQSFKNSIVEMIATKEAELKKHYNE